MKKEARGVGGAKLVAQESIFKVQNSRKYGCYLIYSNIYKINVQSKVKSFSINTANCENGVV